MLLHGDLVYVAEKTKSSTPFVNLAGARKQPQACFFLRALVMYAPSLCSRDWRKHFWR